MEGDDQLLQRAPGVGWGGPALVVLAERQRKAGGQGALQADVWVNTRLEGLLAGTGVVRDCWQGSACIGKGTPVQRSPMWSKAQQPEAGSPAARAHIAAAQMHRTIITSQVHPYANITACCPCCAWCTLRHAGRCRASARPARLEGGDVAQPR